ncbi:hypothetical protein BRY73_04795 [Ochrobactrum sp. P6BS-III]|uniref:DUF2628 domain-containing protein n=1 Tax=unclassified Ochrobactrum TaxID=239106 RepID=UPI000993E50F|nr:hypothetical protein [Ochrobactrum sp. P6BSIII]OOL19227.1 hypothetical protein BRY73_04795 [Ochrobactrum sp. P6BS-III]
MAQFVVLEPTEASSKKKRSGTSVEHSVFVRDGFHVVALVLPFVWLAMQRLWFEAFAVLGVTFLLGFVGSYFGIADAVPLLTLIVSLFVAFEGPNWKIAKLKRQGYIERAAIDASDLDEAEIRYFFGRTASDTTIAEKPVPALDPVTANRWDKASPRPTYSSTGSTIGFVGHRGEN